MLARSGVVRASASKSASESGTPTRRAMAIRWITEFVEPPMASAVTTALRTAAAVMIVERRRSSHTISTIRRPLRAHITACRESTAGIEAAPGSVTPSASAALVIVEAVPIVMQWPGERAMPPSISFQSASVICPARSSAQYFQTSLPEPSGVDPQRPDSIGPHGT
jgi:hypothetical protein